MRDDPLMSFLAIIIIIVFLILTHSGTEKEGRTLDLRSLGASVEPLQKLGGLD